MADNVIAESLAEDSAGLTSSDIDRNFNIALQSPLRETLLRLEEVSIDFTCSDINSNDKMMQKRVTDGR